MKRVNEKKTIRKQQRKINGQIYWEKAQNSKRKRSKTATKLVQRVLNALNILNDRFTTQIGIFACKLFNHFSYISTISASFMCKQHNLLMGFDLFNHRHFPMYKPLKNPCPYSLTYIIIQIL